MQSSDRGSELIDKFIEVIAKKVDERKFRWEFLRGFNSNCKKLISSLEEDNYPEIDIFRPFNMPLPDIPDYNFEYSDKKYNLPFKGGV